MSAVQISHAVRVQVESLLTANFNGKLAAACSDFGITPFTINFTPGTNYFRAGYTLQQLRDIVMLENWPCMTLAVKSATDNHQQFSVKFDGPVNIEIGVYLTFDVNTAGPRIADMETLADAVESALIDSLNVGTAFTGSVSPPVAGTWTMEKGEQDFVNDRWFLPLVFRADFNITA